MLVHIVIVPTPDRTGPDLSRIGTLEDIPDDLARVMLDHGNVRLPTDEERADWEATREAAEAAAAGDLSRLTKAELAKHAEGLGITLPPHATKANILDAIEDHANSHPAMVDVPLPDDAGSEDALAAEQSEDTQPQ